MNKTQLASLVQFNLSNKTISNADKRKIYELIKTHIRQNNISSNHYNIHRSKQIDITIDANYLSEEVLADILLLTGFVLPT